MLAKTWDIQRNCYVWPLRNQMDALHAYADGDLSWEELTGKLQEKLTDELIGKKASLLSGKFSDTYPREIRLLEEVSAASPEEAKNLIEAYFAEPFEISPVRMNLLLNIQATGPQFLEMAICLLPTYLLGKAPLFAVIGRLQNAVACWLDHPRRSVLEENYQPEYQLITNIIQVMDNHGLDILHDSAVSFPIPEMEEYFRKALPKVLEIYINADHTRRQIVL